MKFLFNKKTLTLTLSTTIVWLAFFVFIGGHKASAMALTPNPQTTSTPLTTGWHNFLTSCDQRPYSPAYVQYVSPRSNTASTTAKVRQGDTSVPLRFNYAGAVCLTSSLTSSYRMLIRSSSANNGATVSGIPSNHIPPALTFSPYNKKGVYDQGRVDFNLNNPSGFSGTTTYLITFQTRGINNRVVTPFQNDCTRFANQSPIAANGNGTAVSHYDPCPTTTVSFSIQIQAVKDTPPTVAARIDCTNRRFLASSDDADYNGRNNANYNVNFTIRDTLGNTLNDTSGNPISGRAMAQPWPAEHTFNMTNIAGFSQSNTYRIYVSTRGIQFDGSVGNTIISLDDDPRNRWPNNYITYNCGNLGYELHPNVTVDLLNNSNNPEDENPTRVRVSPSINNDGAATLINGIDYTVALYIKYNNGSPNSNISGYPTSGIVNVNADPFNFGQNTRNIPSLSAGDKVCATLYISPVSGTVNSLGVRQTSSGNEITSEVCQTVVDKPYVKFFSGDVFTGGAFGSTDCSNTAKVSVFSKASGSNYLGSSAQLAIYAMGQITSLSSANLGGSNVNPPGGLSFSNQTGINPPDTSATTPPDLGGNLGGAHCVHDYFGDSTMPNVNDMGVVDTYTIPTTLNSGQYLFKPSSGTLSLSASPDIQNGKHLFIYVDGNVYIPNNLNYGNISWATNKDIPALYIVSKGDIYIDPSVTALDGVYVAQNSPTSTGTIYTCAIASGPYPEPSDADAGKFLPGPSGDCNREQLYVRGTFLASKIKFLRTKYSLRDSNASEQGGFCIFSCPKAAEQFEFTPEIYMADICSDVPDVCASSRFQQGLTSLPPIL